VNDAEYNHHEHKQCHSSDNAPGRVISGSAPIHRECHKEEDHTNGFKSGSAPITSGY